MIKYKITRIWEVEAKNIKEAVDKSKNWKHSEVIIQKARKKIK